MPVPGRSAKGVKLRSTKGVLRKPGGEGVVSTYCGFEVEIEFEMRTYTQSTVPPGSAVLVDTYVGEALIFNTGLQYWMEQAFGSSGQNTSVLGALQIAQEDFTQVAITDTAEFPIGSPPVKPTEHPGFKWVQTAGSPYPATIGNIGNTWPTANIVPIPVELGPIETGEIAGPVIVRSYVAGAFTNLEDPAIQPLGLVVYEGDTAPSGAPKFLWAGVASGVDYDVAAPNPTFEGNLLVDFVFTFKAPTEPAST